MNSETVTVNLNLIPLVFLVFLVLKLAGAITWSWWWIFAPLWMPLVMFVVILGFIALFAAIFD